MASAATALMPIVTTANGNKHVFLGFKRAFASTKSGSTYGVMEDRYWKVDNNEVKDYRLSRYRQRLQMTFLKTTTH